MADWIPVMVAQAWQVTLLLVVVAAINRWAGKSRPHLAHALWLVVLVKCVTPPIWSSPSGLFCWLQPTRETIREVLVFEPPSRTWDELDSVARHSQYKFVVRSENVLVESDVEPEESLIGFGEVSNPVAEVSSITTDKVDWPRVLLGLWVSASLGVLGVAIVRCLRCWRMLRSAPQRDCAELSAQLDALAKQLRLRRRVRLIVTESRLGPAVIGLFRTTVLLPALFVDRLAQRSRYAESSPVAPRQESRTSFDSQSSEGIGSNSPDGSPVAERQGYGSLAPILAHELLHIRRGDLWVGLLQTLAQAVWWCHPLVWWVNRRTTREAERCCDEEVLAELGCDPAAYARALVDVLELKRELKPVPVFPGVRPVEVTTQRLERIMQLGQGCQRRTPWWCWLLAALAAAATWPGAAFVVTAEDPGERGGVSPPVISTSPNNRGADAAPLAGPEISVGTGVNSNSGVIGEVVLEDSDEAISLGDITEIRVEGNELVPTEEILAMIESKVGKPIYEKQMRADVRAIYASRRFYSVEPRLVRADKGVILLFRVIERPKAIVGSKEQAENLQLDGSGHLHWEHPMQRGMWSVSVQPDPGRKLIASDESATKFHSDGRVLVGLTRAEKSLIGYELSGWIRITADEFHLQSNESGQQIRLGGNVRFSGHEFEASCDSLFLNLDRKSENDRFEPGPTAVLRGNVVIRQSKSAEPSELKADRVALCINGSAISRIHRDENGLVAVLRDPTVQDQRLHRKGQKVLAKETLRNLVSENVENVPLKEAIRKLAQSSGRSIVLDKMGLEDEGLSEDVLISLSVAQLKLGDVLTLVTEPLNLGYRVEESGVIVVSSKPRLKGAAVVKTYSVADLAIPKRVSMKLTADRSLVGEASKPSEERTKPTQSLFRELCDLIQSTCQPNSWEEVGGAGRLKANDLTLSLVVRQTQDVHDEIRDLLGQLRRLQQTQAALQIETWTVPDDFWDRLRKLDVDLQTDTLPVQKRPADVLGLQASPAGRLLFPQSEPNPPADAPLLRLGVLLQKEAKLLRSVCQTKASLKVTLFNGQELELIDGLDSPPTRLVLKPILSGDRQVLRLHAAVLKPADVKSGAEPDFTKCAVALPAEHSLLLDVFPQEFSVVEEKSTTLSLNGITTKSVGKKNVNAAHRTLLLITGTVLIAEEEESLLGIPK